MQKRRVLSYYKTYFIDFYSAQSESVKEKIDWTLRLMEYTDVIPEKYLKHLTGTEGLYEIRIQNGSNIFRIFCFFDKKNVIVLGHGLQKKTEKTPRKEIERAKKIRQTYYEENASYQS